MSTQVNTTAQGLSAVAVEEPPLKRAPTLYAIIIFKLIKGVLFCAFGIAMYFQATHDLPKEWDSLLKRPFVEHVFDRLRIHPENKFFHHIAEQIANVTETQVHVWAMGVILFSLFPLVEGTGLLYRVSWAGWLTIGESAFFVPIEVYELARQFTPFMLAVMISNIFIVWYLYANRGMLFHHHHHHHKNKDLD
jgi:uncharacterized membrane protein (DUF2068 family)